MFDFLIAPIAMVFEFILNFLIGIFFYYLGLPFVKLFTLGKYPINSNVFGKSTREDILVACVGLLVLTAIIITFYYAT